MSQYGEPWRVHTVGTLWQIESRDGNHLLPSDLYVDCDANETQQEAAALLNRIVLCVNNCAGLSDENLKTLLDNGHTLASLIVQMQKAHPIFAQVHSQQGQVVYDGNDAHPFQDVLFALVASATAKWNGDHTTAHACLQEARRAKDGLGHEQLAILKAVWREVIDD